ncbi:MAG: sigma 54-interacting transcriptional regulator [Desulfobacteraceae bacterium]|jgi:transcriptional regulator with GAF, ATPase, and Fis domain/tetratricopeptide (TPR) repeat protein|nr:sigma 54-interacting transcriptional regulator [Desulfobacteraceae bacterium]
MPLTKSRSKNGIGEEALQIEKNLAQKALLSGDRDTAWRHLHSVTGRLIDFPGSLERDALFTSTAIELANVSFVLGKGFPELTETLQRAIYAAERIGDRRSMAMINLHLGRLFYFAEKRDSAMSVFEVGKYEAEALGDEDILTQAAEFIGLYYFIQGRFKEAIGYFERAAHSFESEKLGRIINPSGPLWLSYSAAFLGQFHRAIGTLDYYRRVATEGGDHGLAITLRAVLGIMLLGIKKNKEAHFHLSGAYQEARRTKNLLASYFAKGGLAFHHFLEGRLDEAEEWVVQTSEEAESGLIRQYASPLVLETLFELHRKGIKKVRYINYPDEFKRIMHEPNIHLHGVALRLKAIEQVENNEQLNIIESTLIQSEKYLLQSGDPVQTGKTHIEMARLQLRKEDRPKAILLAEKARKDFAGYMDVFFPDDLRPLLTIERDLNQFSDSEDQLLGMFANVIAELSPSADFDYLLSNTVKSTNRYFGAERGGIFWFRHHDLKKGPILRGPCNLSPADISAKDFRDNLALVFKTFHKNRPQVLRRSESGLNPSRVKAMICVPFEVAGQLRGVLYHDNSYVQDCFDNFSKSQLIQMAQWLTSYIDHIFEFSRQMEQKTADQLGQFEPGNSQAIITQSSSMVRTLTQTDHIAVSDSTVLILGETGVGKELLARRIHQMSHRKNNPMITIDPTVIPENLVESELFGHEKGAFTGADRQKKGRMELANKGTLFIDEVGEIPRSIQVKLLRAIQEKTMTRIGGTQNITSDFRLVAATNRNLAEEVAAGRFREDLYYRLNVIPITLPPLREREQDILLLATHFINRFANKYNHPELCLSAENETALKEYSWPGNIRELQNIMERAVLLATDGQLHFDIFSENRASGRNQFDDLPTIDEIQRRYIAFILEKTGGKLSGIGGASEILGMKRTSLYNRMKKLGLR